MSFISFYSLIEGRSSRLSSILLYLFSFYY
uniref:Uncharacterized protein n=1 Tax=Siphoviridae sp. ctPJC19 TaxID=2826321 RepID=A0A8S5M5H9_9CAUD|nr:MAG TPA: hypothetical protein [Siphoviridae sp. ctPJC19]DAE85134.1 MAG TPA: hypothetical protein [Caudoviricetes sp.]DAV43321.1 MAG TPA: hypothetical protein [Caudoviricetes sp.]DAZ53123.1 MAG TPA: hypothetical protein [Caudoviricetes sp.]